MITMMMITITTPTAKTTSSIKLTARKILINVSVQHV